MVQLDNKVYQVFLDRQARHQLCLDPQVQLELIHLFLDLQVQLVMLVRQVLLVRQVVLLDLLERQAQLVPLA